MVNPIDRYLVETECHLRGRIRPDELAATLAETEQHLRERVLAFVELGQEPEGAAQEAVHAFGPAGLYAHSLMEAHRPAQRLLDRKVLRWATFGTLVGAFQVLMLDWVLWQVAVGICLFALMAVLLGSVGSRKVLPLHLTGIALGFSATAWLLSPLFIANLYYYEGTGFLTRREAMALDAAKSNLRYETDRLKRVVNILEDPSLSLEEAVQTAGISVPKPEPGTPVYPQGISAKVPGYADYQTPIQWVDTYGFNKKNDLLFFYRAGAKERQGMLLNVSQSIAAYRRWQGASYRSHLRENLPAMVQTLAIGLVSLLFANFLGAFIGQASARIRRRRWAKV